jgi:hypothetical protein
MVPFFENGAQSPPSVAASRFGPPFFPDLVCEYEWLI